MKIIVTRKAFYQGEVLRIGTILDIKAKKCPVWAEEIKEAKAPEAKTEKTKEEIVDELLTQALDKNIDVDITNKNIDEQIAILQKALEGNK